MPRHVLKQVARKPEHRPSKARRPDLERAMKARGFSSKGLLREQMREMVRQADQVVQPCSLRGLFKMRKAALVRLAASKGIVTKGLTSEQLRLKLQAWRPKPSKGESASSIQSSPRPLTPPAASRSQLAQAEPPTEPSAPQSGTVHRTAERCRLCAECHRRMFLDEDEETVLYDDERCIGLLLSRMGGE